MPDYLSYRLIIIDLEREYKPKKEIGRYNWLDMKPNQDIRHYSDIRIELIRLPDPRIYDLLALFEQISAEENWQPGTALRDHIESSMYIAALADNELVGGVQLVLPRDKTNWWPSRAVWPECDPTSTSNICHVLIMALQKSNRGRPDLFMRLCLALWECCLDRGISEIRLECTPTTYRIYERIGMPLEI